MHCMRIRPQAKAVPKNWDKVDLQLCLQPDPAPEGLEPLMHPRSFAQAPKQGGKHFLQLRMGSIRLKGHAPMHMRSQQHARLRRSVREFWADPTCPCGMGNDSPEHRILHCAYTQEARAQIAGTIARLAEQPMDMGALHTLWQSTDSAWSHWWGLAGWWPKAAAWQPKNCTAIWQKWTQWVGAPCRDVSAASGS